MSNSWEKLHTRWLLAAMAAPLTQAASNCSWPAAICIGVLCLGICWGLEWAGIGAVQTRVLGAIQWLWMLLVVSEFLHWVMLCWPDNGNYYGAPLILLTLAALAAAKGKESSAQAGGVLFWIILLLLGAILLSAIPQIEWNYLKPQWRMQTANLILVTLIPAMGSGMGRTQKKGLLIYLVLVSAVTTGVMSMDLIDQMHAPFYEMSETVSLLGVGRRFEALTAVGMTLGYFVLTCYLLHVMAKAWEMGKRQNRSVWISAVFSAMIFVSGMRLNSRLLALGTMGIWVVLPVLEKIAKK